MKPNRKNEREICKIVAEAEKLGMSYGKYVVWMDEQKKKKGVK